MEGLRERVRRVLRAAQLLKAGDRVLVGVSGGADSVALVHLLVSLQEELRIQLAVVHVDHQLRPDSADDAACVEELARQLALPVTIVRRDVRGDSAGHGLSLEDAARRVRYHAFLETATRQRATRLALAHTADDQAETVMMRLLRGAGISGLTAIPMTRSLGDEVMVIRPLLGVWRHELLAYLTAQRLSARYDSTNGDMRFLRNRVRARLLPLLAQEYNPNIKALLNQLAEQCRTDAEFLHTAAKRHWKRLVKSENGHLAIRIAGWLQQPRALQRQLIRLAIQQLQGDLTGFEFRHWLEIERLFADRPVGTVLDLPGELRLERERERVLVRRSSPRDRTPRLIPQPAALN